jgi:hypothetical protein
MGETRVDLLHLLEDLRDAYPSASDAAVRLGCQSGRRSGRGHHKLQVPRPSRWQDSNRHLDS